MGIQRSTLIFDHGHFPLRTIDIKNISMHSASKEAVSFIIFLRKGVGTPRVLKIPCLLVLNVDYIGMRTPTIMSVISSLYTVAFYTYLRSWNILQTGKQYQSQFFHTICFNYSFLCHDILSVLLLEYD